MAGLVMPSMLSLKIFRCLFAHRLPSPIPPFPRPDMVVAVVVVVEFEVEVGVGIGKKSLGTYHFLTDFSALSLALIPTANARADKKQSSTGTKNISSIKKVRHVKEQLIF